MKDENFELLKFNYGKLHESLWESHKVAWTATSILIPVIFALQGYLAKEYLIADKRPPIEVPLFGVLIVGLLSVIWRLMLLMLEHYNDKRVGKLRAIEEVFKDQFEKREGIETQSDSPLSSPAKQSALVMQYGDFSYRRKILGISFSWNRIYNIILEVIAAMNVLLITYIWRGRNSALRAIALFAILDIVARMLNYMIRTWRGGRKSRKSVSSLSDIYEELRRKKKKQRDKKRKWLDAMVKRYKYKDLRDLVKEMRGEADRLGGGFGELSDGFEKLRAELDAEERRDSIILTTAQEKAKRVREIVREYKKLELEIKHLEKARDILKAARYD